MCVRNWAAIIVAAGLLAGAGVASAHGGASHDASKEASQPVAGNNRWGANYFPNVTLTTQDGKTVRFYDDLLKGKAVAINFIYTDCNEVCPLETATLAHTYKLLGARAGREVHFYSISI